MAGLKRSGSVCAVTDLGRWLGVKWFDESDALRANTGF